MAHPSTPQTSKHLTLAALQRIKLWQLEHKRTHPLEYHSWDAVLTLWVMGWVGWVPTFALGDLWASLLCLLGMVAPRLYVAWRLRAHEAGRLRCDWLDRIR
jgi:hypothetical protein